MCHSWTSFYFQRYISYINIALITKRQSFFFLQTWKGQPGLFQVTRAIVCALPDSRDSNHVTVLQFIFKASRLRSSSAAGQLLINVNEAFSYTELPTMPYGCVYASLSFCTNWWWKMSFYFILDLSLHLHHTHITQHTVLKFSKHFSWDFVIMQWWSYTGAVCTVRYVIIYKIQKKSHLYYPVPFYHLYLCEELYSNKCPDLQR